MIGNNISGIEVERTVTVEGDFLYHCIEELVFSGIRRRPGIGGNFIGADINPWSHDSEFAVDIALPERWNVIWISCIMAWRTGGDVVIVTKKRVLGYIAVKAGFVGRTIIYFFTGLWIL